MKNTNKYTPGPWKVQDNYNGVLPVDGWNEDAGESVEICRVSDDGGDMEANAALIAAGPELLGALEMMCDMFLQDHRDGHEWPQYKLARAAIAKAKGGKYP